jgi:transcription factor CP2-like protein
MATSSWRLEDLQQLEELGLAGQLESTRLQEEGAGGERDQHGAEQDQPPQADQDLYTMSAVLSDLLMTEAASSACSLPQPSAQPTVMETTLMAPTAHGVKHGSPVVTYVNRGQWYEIHFVAREQDTKNDGLYRCVLSLGFSELRMRNNECELLDRWGQDHPCERLLDIDRRGCDGVSHVEDSESLNSLSWLWPSRQRGIVSVKINCLSSEFVAKKHGGEKGILLLLSMDVYHVGHEQHHLQRSGCNIKVFKDKGGDRKQKQDQLKVEKLTVAERERYQPSQDVTYFSLLPSVNQPPTSSSPLQSSQSQPPQLHSSPISPLVGATSQSNDLGVMSSIREAHQWLATHHFSSYLSLFSSYSGADLLRLSRRDLMELCGPADGIRLFNALRSRSLRTVYVCLGDKTVYHILTLEQLTAQELLYKLAEKVGLQLCQVSCVLQLTSSGILVMVDDTVVRNMCDEDSFVVSTVKEQGTGTYQLILHTPPSSGQPSLASQSRTDCVLNSSLEQ